MHRTASVGSVAACAIALLIGASACGGGGGGAGAFSRKTERSTTSSSTATTKPTTASTAPAATGEIAELQTQLNKLGCDAGTVDGSAGATTAEAVKRFQTAAGLGADGVAGPETKAKLAEAARDGSPNCKGGATSEPSPP